MESAAPSGGGDGLAWDYGVPFCLRGSLLRLPFVVERPLLWVVPLVGVSRMRPPVVLGRPQWLLPCASLSQPFHCPIGAGSFFKQKTP